MKLLILLVVILAGAVAAGLLLRDDPGYVFMGFGQWSVEMELWVFAVLNLVLLSLVYLSLRSLLGVWRVPRRLARSALERARQRARRGLTQGLIELAEGRWERAERLLMRDAGRSEHALLHFLGAARAAQQQGAHERRDSYLKRAIEGNPQADMAVSLTQAELQLAHQQSERALASLARLRNLAPKHEYVLRLLTRLYLQLEDWPRLAELLQEIDKKHLFEREEFERMQLATWHGLLKPAANQSADELQARWDALPRAARESSELLQAYVERLVWLNAGQRAEPLLRSAIARDWDGKLVRLYGLVSSGDDARQLDHAEAWLKNHGRDPWLLLTLGRLCKKRSLWGKARIYLESSLGINPRAETHLELAELLESLGESDGALEQYRLGLALSVELPNRRKGVVRALPVKSESAPSPAPSAPADISVPVG